MFTLSFIFNIFLNLECHVLILRLYAIVLSLNVNFIYINIRISIGTTNCISDNSDFKL